MAFLNGAKDTDFMSPDYKLVKIQIKPKEQCGNPLVLMCVNVFPLSLCVNSS